MTRIRIEPSLRAFVTTTLALAAGLSLVGCGSEKGDRAAVAAAKCTLPVAEEAGFDVDAQHPRKEDVEVQDLGGGSYSVSGRMFGGTDFEQRSVDFVCEVAPDASDKLRGFKVTELKVTPTR